MNPKTALIDAIVHADAGNWLAADEQLAFHEWWIGVKSAQADTAAVKLRNRINTKLSKLSNDG